MLFLIKGFLNQKACVQQPFINVAASLASDGVKVLYT